MTCMAKHKQINTEVFVPHPRYGAVPVVSGLAVTEETIRRAHWRYDKAKIFPESAILADTSKQNYALYPRSYYVDIVRQCVCCQRSFIFFAREQRHWFETLRFYVDADSVHCPECRKSKHVIKRSLKRYSDLLRLTSPSRKDLMFLVEDATYLLEQGVLRDLNRLGELKNQALKHIPEYEGTALLALVIARAREMAITQTIENKKPPTPTRTSHAG